MNVIEAIRRRPAMYLGDTGSWGLLRHTISAVEFVLANHAKRIEITLGGAIRVEANALVSLRMEDDGSLFPFETPPHSSDECALAPLLVCALSRHFRVLASDGNVETSVAYEAGRRVLLERRPVSDGAPHVVLEFSADPLLFSNTETIPQAIMSHIRRHGWQHPDVCFFITAAGETWHHQANRGLEDFFNAAASPYPWLHAPIHVRERAENLEVEAFALFLNVQKNRVFSFANRVCTPRGGTHEQGLVKALATIRKGIRVDGRVGVVAVLAIEYPALEYEGSVRLRVGNPDLVEKVFHAVSSGMSRWIASNPQAYSQLLEIQPFHHPW